MTNTQLGDEAQAARVSATRHREDCRCAACDPPIAYEDYGAIEPDLHGSYLERREWFREFGDS